MPIPSITNSIVATSSGIIGGVFKALSSGFAICTISFSHIIDVAVYAAISALVGYMVKLAVDTIRRKTSNNQKSKSL